MARSEKDIMQIPAYGGEWAFRLTSGDTFKGEVIDRHDNAVEVRSVDDKGHSIAMNIMNSQIVYCFALIPEVEE